MTTKNTENKISNKEALELKKTRKCSICKKEGHDKRKCESNKNILPPSETNNNKDIPINKELTNNIKKIENSNKNIITINDIKKQKYSEPKCKWDSKIEDEIKMYIRSSLSKTNNNIFENISEYFQTFYDRPCNNMNTLKKRTRNELGFIWEHFCLMYLRAKGYGECWLISEVPSDILEKLNLSRMDMGIDIVIKHDNGFFAVQAKWRTNKNKSLTISLTWNKLSTFYALCARSGPWLKFIVMTNCDFVRRQGRKNKMDQTIAKGSFLSCKRDIWNDMCGFKGNTLDSNISITQENKEENSKTLQETKQQNTDIPFNQNNKENTKQTLQEIQRLQRSAFLDKMFPSNTKSF
jgi:hypothetical protein